MKDFLNRLLSSKKFWSKLLAFSFIGAFLYGFKNILFLFFVAFVLGFLIYSLSDFLNSIIVKLISKLITKKTKLKNFICRIFSINIFVTLFYALFVVGIFFLVYNLLPKVIIELKEMPDKIPFAKDYIKDYVVALENFTNLNRDLSTEIAKLINEKNVGVLNKIISITKNVGTYIIQFLIGFILSYIFIIERKRVKSYLENFKIGILSDVYLEIKKVAKKFAKWFGLIFKAQAMISLVNTVLTAIGLYTIGFINGFHFPYLLTLSVIVFLLGFVPLAGTFLSSLPIILIGFSIGGVKVALYIALLIIIIHMIEAYILNPKIVGTYVKLPMAITLVILIISEHIFGIKGLIIGIPVFFVLIDLVIDMDKHHIDEKLTVNK